jgi:hypothetical protein
MESTTFHCCPWYYSRDTRTGDCRIEQKGSKAGTKICMVL